MRGTVTTSTQLIVEAIVGYITTPLVSLLARRRFPPELRLTFALIVAAIAATVVVSIDRDGTKLPGWTASFGRVFTMQQITWGLKIPGAGDERINEQLLNVGSR